MQTFDDAFGYVLKAHLFKFEETSCYELGAFFILYLVL